MLSVMSLVVCSCVMFVVYTIGGHITLVLLPIYMLRVTFPCVRLTWSGTVGVWMIWLPCCQCVCCKWVKIEGETSYFEMRVHVQCSAVALQVESRVCVFCLWFHCLFRCYLQIPVLCCVRKFISDFISRSWIVFIVDVCSVVRLTFYLICSGTFFLSFGIWYLSVCTLCWWLLCLQCVG